MIIEEKDLPEIRKKIKGKIALCTGVFDLTHVGHVLFFEDCKKYGDLVVVGVGKDSLIKQYKGDRRPILNEKIRLKTVDSIKAVDYVFLIEQDKWDNEKSNREILAQIFRALKPDNYIFNEDVWDKELRKEIAYENGVKAIILPRYCPEEFDNISTTKIISLIKEVYIESSKKNI